MPSSFPVSPNKPVPPLSLCTTQMPPPFPFNHPLTFSQWHSPCSSPLCTLLQPTISHSPHTPSNHPVTFSQQHSPYSSALCTPLQPTGSQSPTYPIQSPSNIQSEALTMQLPTMHSPAANCFPIPPHIPFNHPVTLSQQHSQCSSPICTLLQPTVSQSPQIPSNLPVTFSQQHSPCSSPLCTPLQPTVSQSLSPTNISLSTIFEDVLESFK